MKRLPTFIALALSLAAVVILIINVDFYLTTKPYIYASASDAPKAQVALILGAAILADDTPAPIFIDRANVAIDLYKERKVSKILVSGDNSTVSHNEVNPVRLYLLSQGIPDQDIFLDHAGFDTYSSLYRARDIFQVSSILITSQSFHLPRAVFIARHLGIVAYGVDADEGHILFSNYVREIFADEKAVFDLVVHTKPKYLGDVIPITGDGRDTAAR